MREPHIHPSFETADLDPRFRWHCPPQRWEIDTARRALRIWPDAATDFWQTTHYGFNIDNGHFLCADVTGDFILQVHVRFDPVHQYDQAGVMVRLSPACWLKASVEYEPDGDARLGAVVTNFTYSDWSTQRYARGPGALWFRVRREEDDYIVDTSPDGQAWTQIRMAHLHEARGKTITCGIYACSPKASGYVAEFSDLSIDLGRLD